MMIIPQSDCCTMLGIDPKTLRNWMRHAALRFSPHPTDARLKCLAMEHIEQLATLHGRPLPSPVSASPFPQEGSGQATPVWELAASLAPTSDLVPASPSEEMALRTSVASLQRSVATLQEQLAHLALELLHERELRYEQRLSTLETRLQQTLRPAPDFPQTNVVVTPSPVLMPSRHVLPVERHARSRVIPLIEYGAQGSYVAVCPQEGVLSLAAESPEWLDWLASLSSFRFVAPQGRFTAYRDTSGGRPTRAWVAYRRIHGRSYRHGLGVTDRLTIPHLEQMAATFQSYLG
jgi:hypothetical protein